MAHQTHLIYENYFSDIQNFIITHKLNLYDKIACYWEVVMRKVDLNLYV